MLAHSPYEPEIDFKDLMHVHESPEQVVHIVDEWLARIHEQKKTLSPSGKEQQKQRRALQRIHLGEYVAEDEKLELPNYFIETGVFNNALATSQYMIYVGRKGTGKTANLFSIAERLVSDIRENNLVCVIRPEDWELEGVYKLYQLSLSRSEIGYLVESLWKYLIFTELANTIYISLYRKAVGMRTESENYFCDFIDSHYHLVSSDFETRLTNALNELCQIDTSGPAAEKKQKVSEILHDGMLSRLRELLGQVMETKGKVFVLVDNLDKTWFERDDLGILSEFLFGLLNVGQELPSRFARRDSRLKQISLTLIIFLRSDIYSHMVALARERGKLKIQQINWDDEILLLRLIEERFRSSLGEELSPEEIWGRFFAEEVDGIPTMQYLTRRIIPRPRDMIVFCKQAHLNAVNHGHHRIEATDIKQAEYVYSRHAFNEFVDETKARFPMVEDLAYELAGANRIIEREFLENCIARVGYPPGNAQDVISLLTDATFLGLEIRENEFAYIYDPQRKGVLKTLAVKCAEDSGVERFEINYPFRLFLEIKE